MSDAASLSHSATTFSVPGGIDAPALARRAVLGHYPWLGQRVRDAAALMLAEVVSNAVLHGGAGHGTEVRIDVAPDTDTITFTVYDPGAGFTPPPPDEPAPSGGFGLLIVDRLARRWGVLPGPTGTRVWFEVGLT